MDRQFRHGVLRLPHARLRETLRRSGLVDTASQFFLAVRVLLVDVTRVVVVVFARDHSPVVYKTTVVADAEFVALRAGETSLD